MQLTKGSVIFGLTVGLLVAVTSYRWITDPEYGAERRMQEQVVLESRSVLSEVLSLGIVQLVDPMSPDRKVGKTYINPAASGWEVSGFYRRDSSSAWIPYLVKLDENRALISLTVSDESLRSVAEDDDRVSIAD